MHSPDQAMEHFVTVGRQDEVPSESGRVFMVGELAIAVFHHGGAYYAIDDSCPHMGASLAEGHVDQCIVACPWHGWRFDVRDGTWCDNPRVKIGAYPVRLVNGEIQVAVPPSSDDR